MPLYEYQCDSCGHRFESIQKFSDPPLELCPKCGSALRKLQSAPSFQFKGTGWYITDYAKKDGGSTERSGESGAAAKDGESSKSSESKADSRSDSKGESKSDGKGESKGEKKGEGKSGSSDSGSSASTPATPATKSSS